MNVLVTGAAGFIGFHLINRLLERGCRVVGVDNINAYYDVRLKYRRLQEAGIATEEIDWGQKTQSDTWDEYDFIRLDLEDRPAVEALFRGTSFDVVCHLAAQAGVRYSLENPHAYIGSNIIGFLNILEGCRHHDVKHLVYASSSSVYGLNEKLPLSEKDNVDHPVALYAATKKSNELMAHAYSHLYALPTTGLRFFTVYGPWGRPDMALFLFTKAILNDEPIAVFNRGQMQRDFTYVDDIVTGVYQVLSNPPKGNTAWSGLTPDPSSSNAPFRIYNIGNSKPVNLLDFIACIERELGKTAVKKMMPMQPGDVPATFADVTALSEDFGYLSQTDIAEGVSKFVAWYRHYYDQSQS